LEAKKRKQNKMIDHTIDKGFVKALKYGLPFCTGAGIGFERLVMIFSNTKSIDELKLISIK
ncbi:MAG: amino acid--tRNA ligase-related protein, partial [Patescibacteria group bacterium]